MQPAVNYRYSLEADRQRATRRAQAKRSSRVKDLVIVAVILASVSTIVCCAAIVLAGGFGGAAGPGSNVAGPPNSSASSGPSANSDPGGGFDDNVQAEPAPQSGQPTQTVDPDTDLEGFSASVFADIQDSWSKVFSDQGTQYREAQLSLYSGATYTACGTASSSVGPFYCPGDETVYIDPSFYDQMRDQLGASGDFAWAYVIAHELGHHVQTLTGSLGAGQTSNEQSVRTELQADCYAGVWGQTAYKKGQLEDGDLEEGINAAASVGDDRIQGGTGQISPDSFTHGTSQQRVNWFKTGFDSGKPESCDTFSPASV